MARSFAEALVAGKADWTKPVNIVSARFDRLAETAQHLDQAQPDQQPEQRKYELEMLIGSPPAGIITASWATRNVTTLKGKRNEPITRRKWMLLPESNPESQ